MKQRGKSTFCFFARKLMRNNANCELKLWLHQDRKLEGCQLILCLIDFPCGWSPSSVTLVNLSGIATWSLEDFPFCWFFIFWDACHCHEMLHLQSKVIIVKHSYFNWI